MKLKQFFLSSLFISQFALSPSVQAQVSDSVLMEGNGTVVTEADVRWEMTRMPADLQQKVLSDQKSLKQVIENIYIRRAAAQDGKIITAKNPEARQTLQNIEERLYADLALETLENASKLSDDAALAYAQATYKAEPQRFIQPNVVTVKQLQWPVRTINDQVAALKAALATFDAIQAGQPIDEASKKFGTTGGAAVPNLELLERVAPSSQSPEFNAAVSKLRQPGNTSLPFMTASEVQLIQLVAQHPNAQREFATVQEMLMKEARSRRAGEIRSAEIGRLLTLGKGDQGRLEQFASKLKTSPPTTSASTQK